MMESYSHLYWKKPLVFQVIQMQVAYLTEEKTFLTRIDPSCKSGNFTIFQQLQSPSLSLCCRPYIQISLDLSPRNAARSHPSSPVFPGAVVQSQLFSMVQLHLDAARTSLRAWGRGICTSLNCVVLGLHHSIVRGCSVWAGERSAVNLRSFLAVQAKLCKNYTVRKGDTRAPLTDWLTYRARRPTAGRQTGIMTQGKVRACFNRVIQLIPSLSTVNNDNQKQFCIWTLFLGPVM